ncbi:MAG TPA: hypothetical protein VGF00_09515, partial [Acidimicrobiia bacterium]
MTPSSADRPGRPGPGTEPLRFGARAAAAPEAGPRATAGGWSPPPAKSALWSGRDDGDTGPVPIVGGRPSPPPLRPADEPPTTAVAPGTDQPPTAAVAPVTDDPKDDQAGDQDGDAIDGPKDDQAGDQDGDAIDDLTDDPADLPTTERPVGGRAGRNLGQAIGVGLSLAAVIVVSLVVWRPAFLGVVTAAVLVAVVELTRALQAGRFRPPLVPLLVGSLAMEALAWSRGETGLVTGFLLTALAVVVWRLGHGPAGYRRDAAAGV